MQAQVLLKLCLCHEDDVVLLGGSGVARSGQRGGGGDTGGGTCAAATRAAAAAAAGQRCAHLNPRVSAGGFIGACDSDKFLQGGSIRPRRDTGCPTKPGFSKASKVFSGINALRSEKERTLQVWTCLEWQLPASMEYQWRLPQKHRSQPHPCSQRCLSGPTLSRQSPTCPAHQRRHALLPSLSGIVAGINLRLCFCCRHNLDPGVVQCT